MLKQQVGDLSKELHQLNFNLKVEKLINIELREDLEQLSDKRQKAGTNKSNKKPATKKILTKEDTEKKDKPQTPVQFDDVVVIGNKAIPRRSPRLSNAFTTKPGTPDHSIVLALTKQEFGKQQAKKKIDMNDEKANTSNTLKALMWGPIGDMKPKGIHLSAMITYLHCNKMFKGCFETVTEGADVKRIKYGSCDVPFAVGERSKYYCALELCIYCCGLEDLDKLEGPVLPVTEIEILAQKIQRSAMERILMLEGRAGRGDKRSSRHTPAFLGVGIRVLKYKKTWGNVMEFNNAGKCNFSEKTQDKQFNCKICYTKETKIILYIASVM